MADMSPFELRLELLKLAKDILTNDWESSREKDIQNYNLEVDILERVLSLSNITIEQIRDIKYPVHPGFLPYPSELDIIEKAKSMNGFISNGR